MKTELITARLRDIIRLAEEGIRVSTQDEPDYQRVTSLALSIEDKAKLVFNGAYEQTQ